MLINTLLAEISSLRAKLASGNDVGNDVSVKVKNFLENLDSDIRRLQAEQESRQSQELQMEMALCFSEDAVSITTAEGNIRLVNPAFERLSGFAGPEIIGKTLDLLWSEVPQNNAGLLADAIKHGRQWRGELVCRTKTGEQRTTELSVAPIPSPIGAVTHYVHILRDITERKKLEKKIVTQKELLEKVINLASNAIMVIDPKGQWELDNIRAKTLLSDMGENSLNRLSEILISKIGTKSHVKGAKIEVELSGGQASVYLMEAEKIPSSYLIPGPSEGILFLITLTDITQLEAKSRDLLMRQKILSASKIEQGLVQNELANGFIYRMRQPINVGMAISARMEELVKRKDLESLEINAKLIGDLIANMERELLTFREQSSPTDVSGNCRADALTTSLETIYRERCATDGVRLETEFSVNGVSISVAEEMLQMVFLKLLDNACESVAGIDGPKIKLSFWTRGDYLNAAVEDNGSGIPENERYSVFEPFHSTKTHRTGLSLALVHQVINRAGGWVSVESSALGGAKLSIRIPLAGKK
jgi:nitrogen fixation negative regulator NifL